MQTAGDRNHSFTEHLHSASVFFRAAVRLFGFCLALSSVCASDVSSCYVRKTQIFRQTSEAMPVWWTTEPFSFQASVFVDSSNAINAATIEFPDESFAALSWLSTNYRASSYGYRTNFSSAESLNETCPNGTYTITIDTANDSTQRVALDLVTPVFPNAPWVSNYYAAQTINAASDFVLQWGPYVDATTNDTIKVEIWRNPTTLVYTTPDNVPFNGTNTSLVIPGTTLQYSQTYQVFLVFLRTTDHDTNRYPGVPCGAGCNTSTFFPIRTLPQLHISVSNSVATLSWPSPYTDFVLEANAIPEELDEWVTVTNMSLPTNGSYTMTLDATNRAMFYRLSRN